MASVAICWLIVILLLIFYSSSTVHAAEEVEPKLTIERYFIWKLCVRPENGLVSCIQVDLRSFYPLDNTGIAAGNIEFYMGEGSHEAILAAQAWQIIALGNLGKSIGLNPELKVVEVDNDNGRWFIERVIRKDI